MRRLITLAAILGAILANVGSVNAATSTSTGFPFHPRLGKFLGIIPPMHKNAPVNTASSGSGGHLYYNGGPVMTTNKVYTVFWQPTGFTFSTHYQSLINQYFGDLQADNGKTSNVYETDTQYSQQNPDSSLSYIHSNTTFSGTAVDTNALPALDPVNCPDHLAASNGVNGTTGGNPANTNNVPAACVTDGQLQQELSRVIKQKGWHPDNNTEFFMYTAKNIGTCFSAPIGAGAGNVGTSVSPPLCSFQYFCAYHSSYFDSTISTNSQIIYSNMPYAAETAGNPLTCDMGQYPNADDADATINVTSHEHNESITDPFGTGWWDSNSSDANAGQENGDMCNFNFGTTYGATGSQFSQTINGHHYLMQTEYNNVSDSCAQIPTPTVTLTPNIGYPTAPMKIDHTLFFAPNEPVTYNFTSHGVTTPETIGTTTADANGQVSKIMLKVPADALAGVGQVSIAGGTSGATNNAAFTVPDQ